jgi:Protein of unknown function (DUF4238)
VGVNDPHRHHYIPAFYLKQWAGGDGFVCVMRKVPSGLSILRRSPKATGFKRDLYKIDKVPTEEAQQFESVFLKAADNDAYRALLKLLKDNQNWDARLKSAWARFIMSLLFRNPETATEIRSHILTMWEVGLEAVKQGYKPEEHGGRSFEEYFAEFHAAIPHVDAAQFLRNIIDNQRIGDTIVGMHWNVVELDRSQHLLMTSDRPLDMPGLGDDDAYISLPIGPRCLFVASRKRDFVTRLRQTPHSQIARQVNLKIVSQAREYVWAFSEAQSTFVKGRICTVPDRVVLSEKNKQEALDAVRAGRPQQGSLDDHILPPQGR